MRQVINVDNEAIYSFGVEVQCKVGCVNASAEGAEMPHPPRQTIFLVCFLMIIMSLIKCT